MTVLELTVEHIELLPIVEAVAEAQGCMVHELEFSEAMRLLFA